MSEGDPIAAALQARLETIEHEIDRLTRLAAAEEDADRTQKYWELARDVQSEARKLRNEFAKIVFQAGPARRPLLAGLWKAFKRHDRTTMTNALEMAAQFPSSRTT